MNIVKYTLMRVSVLLICMLASSCVPIISIFKPVVYIDGYAYYYNENIIKFNIGYDLVSRENRKIFVDFLNSNEERESAGFSKISDEEVAFYDTVRRKLPKADSIDWEKIENKDEYFFNLIKLDLSRYAKDKEQESIYSLRSSESGYYYYTEKSLQTGTFVISFFQKGLKRVIYLSNSGGKLEYLGEVNIRTSSETRNELYLCYKKSYFGKFDNACSFSYNYDRIDTWTSRNPTFFYSTNLKTLAVDRKILELVKQGKCLASSSFDYYDHYNKSLQKFINSNVNSDEVYMLFYARRLSVYTYEDWDRYKAEALKQKSEIEEIAKKYGIKKIIWLSDAFEIMSH